MGILTRPTPSDVHVLAYHVVGDLSHDRELRTFGVTTGDMAAQLSTLRDAGYAFVDGDALVAHVRGEHELDRAVLVTFDDAYANLLDAIPVLREHDIRAIVFAVSARVGRTNEWDAAPGRDAMPLLDSRSLCTLASAGFEIGAHSRTHAHLCRADDAALRDETTGSRDDLEAMGLPRPRAFAHPYAEHDERVRAAVAAAGFTLGFGVGQRSVPPQCDPMAIPRIEPQPGEWGTKLLRRLKRA